MRDFMGRYTYIGNRRALKEICNHLDVPYSNEEQPEELLRRIKIKIDEIRATISSSQNTVFLGGGLMSEGGTNDEV